MKGRTKPLPRWLKPSAKTDIEHVQAGIRRVLRTELLGAVPEATVRAWATHHGWFVRIDGAFVSFSPTAWLARRVIDIDRSTAAHAYLLGILLGYPACCCRAAARSGEQAIDAQAERLAKHRFVGLFRLTDPKDYVRGKANISHVPCSRRCIPSLGMALSYRRADGGRMC